MLDIATPILSSAEWQGVRRALDTVTERRCGEPVAPASQRGRIGRTLDALAGRDPSLPETSPEQRAIRAFLCASGRIRRVAEDHVPTLNALGFSRAQIEAMALIAA